MSDLSQGIGDGLHLIVTGDPDVVSLTVQSLRIAGESTTIAAVIAVPLGCALGLGRFRGRRGVLAATNALVRFPPVAIGLIAALLLWPNVTIWGGGPLSGLGWLYSLKAIILVQTLIAIPIIASLTASAVQGAAPALLAQAAAFGASPLGRARLALREAWVGVVAAIIAGVGVTIGTIGAIVVVGGAFAQTSLAPAVLLQWSMGTADAAAVAYATVLLLLFVVIAAALTVVQQRRGPAPRPGGS